MQGLTDIPAFCNTKSRTCRTNLPIPDCIPADMPHQLYWVKLGHLRLLANLFSKMLSAASHTHSSI